MKKEKKSKRKVKYHLYSELVIIFILGSTSSISLTSLCYDSNLFLTLLQAYSKDAALKKKIK